MTVSLSRRRERFEYVREAGRITRRAGAQRRTALPLTRLYCGGYPGFFVVRADFQQRRRSLYLVRRYLLTTCT